MTKPTPSSKKSLLWISGCPSDGKSPFAKLITQSTNCFCFETDRFVSQIDTWWDASPKIDNVWSKYGRKNLGKFLDNEIASSESRTQHFIEQFTNPEMGFHPSEESEFAIIEGYIPTRIQNRIANIYHQRGWYVWFAMRTHRFEQMVHESNWRPLENGQF